MTSENRRKAIPKEMAKARAAAAAAEHAIAGGHHEAAINRAYYCVFHAARAALLTLGVQPRTHKGVNQRFNLDLVVPGTIEAEYLSMLGRLEAQRDAADYAIDVAFTATQATSELETARRFLERIERFLADGGWPAV